MEHRFEYLTSEELKPFIERKALIIMGIGAIEEHGAHLPTGTDWFITQRFTDDLAVYLKAHSQTPFLTLPAIWTGYSATLMQAWPGAIRMATRTVMDMMRQIIGSLCEMGFDKFLILNSHRHHAELLPVVAREVADDHGVFPVVVNFLSLGAREYNVARTGPAGASIHGGEDETSVMLHYGYPADQSKYTIVDHVHYHTEFMAGDNYLGSTKVFWSTWECNLSKISLLGDPTSSTPELGTVLVEAAFQHLARFVEEYWWRGKAKVAR
ncbi:MAG: creatininase family protein [Anaerolineae bacterium]